MNSKKKLFKSADPKICIKLFRAKEPSWTWSVLYCLSFPRGALDNTLCLWIHPRSSFCVNRQEGQRILEREEKGIKRTVRVVRSVHLSFPLSRQDDSEEEIQGALDSSSGRTVGRLTLEIINSKEGKHLDTDSWTTAQIRDLVWQWKCLKNSFQVHYKVTFEVKLDGSYKTLGVFLLTSR
jgi:hypothetical protein